MYAHHVFLDLLMQRVQLPFKNDTVSLNTVYKTPVFIGISKFVPSYKQSIFSALTLIQIDLLPSRSISWNTCGYMNPKLLIMIIICVIETVMSWNCVAVCYPEWPLWFEWNTAIRFQYVATKCPVNNAEYRLSDIVE